MSLKLLIHSRHLPTQSPQQKHQNKALTTPKVDNKDISTTPMASFWCSHYQPQTHPTHRNDAMKRYHTKILYKDIIQRNDIMGKSFTHCTIDVMTLVILICNEKLLLSCPTKINMNQRSFSQTWWINWDILQSPNVPAKQGLISDIANSRSRLPTIL